MSHLFYGVAYYDEYMPEDRLAKDIALMRETGINVVRIAESTWSTLEPEEGQYNFYHIDRVLAAMHEAGIAVIVGTPTYAVPAWLAAKHPDILVTTVAGQQKYGPRQIMDIVNPTFRRYAEKIIRTLMAHVQHHPAIIGWQLDNETKHYDNIGRYMQEGFVRSLQEKYPDLRQLNRDFGLQLRQLRRQAGEIGADGGSFLPGWVAREVVAEQPLPVGFKGVMNRMPVPVGDHGGAGGDMAECLQA